MLPAAFGPAHDGDRRGPEQPEKFTPTYHLGIESAMPWLTVQDDLPRTQCKDSPSLVEAYAMAGQSVP